MQAAKFARQQENWRTDEQVYSKGFEEARTASAHHACNHDVHG
jgi:hypothetical protein